MRQISSSCSFDISKKTILFFVFLFLLSAQVSAAVVTWDGGGATNNWSDAANWSTGVTPDATSNVVFNSGSSASTVDSSFAGTVSTVTIESSYTGTIEQLSNLTVNGSFIQRVGWFNSDRTKTFSVGGSFQIPSGEAHNFTRFSGSGTEGDPYLIYDIYGLQALNGFLGQSNGSVYFEMANNVDASVTSHWNWTGSAYQGFCPIGYFPDSYHYDPGGGSTQSEVRFNGRDKVISNLYIYRPAQFYVGLFGYRNADTGYLSITNANITGSIHTGILAGWNNGSVVGYCYSSGSVTGTETTGGLVGMSNGGSFWLCHSTASVASSGQYTGGLVGRGGAGYLNCYATGNVTGDYDSQGGFVGWFNGTVNGCYSAGNVIGLSNCFNTGGFVGNNAGGTIMDSYSTGNVTVGSGASSIGGFAGQGFQGTFTRCYSTGKVTAASAGGFLGLDSGGTPSTNTSCYWDSAKNPALNSSSAGSLTGVSGKTTTQMKQRATYSGWHFDDIWTIDEGKSTPQEMWQIFNWMGETGGSWTTLSNWRMGNLTPEAYPQNNTHKVFIGGGGAITVPADITLGGLQLGSGYSDTVTLGGDLKLSSSGTREGSLNLFGGTFDAATYSIEINGNFIKGASSTFADDDSIVYFTGSTPSSIEGQTSFKRFVCTTPGKVLVFGSGYVNTIEAGGFLTIEGNSFNPITLKSAVPGSQWTIHPLSKKSFSNCIVYDSSNISDEAIVTVSSVDGGNNTGWSFDSHLFQTFSNAGGTIEPGGLIIVPTGTAREFSIYADSGYYLYDVKIDGVSTIDAFSVPYLLTFESVSSTHTIEAVFYQDSFRVWDGGGATNNWSDAANWSGNITPEVGALILFDATSVKDSTIDASFHGSIYSITIESSYAGTITQSSHLTIEGSFIQSGGFFNSDTTKLFTVGESFSITFEAGTFKRFTGSGGSAEDPYVIYDVYGLQAMKCNMSAYFRLNNNIDASQTLNWNWNAALSTFEGFSPVGFSVSEDIGDITNPFTGDLDGNYKTISGLYIDRQASVYLGLFGAIYRETGGVRALTLESVSIRGSAVVGGLFGWNTGGTIANCHVSGSVAGYIGAGLLGGIQFAGAVSNSTSSGNVYSSGLYAGGLFGAIDSAVVSNCRSSAAVAGVQYVGGLAGAMGIIMDGGQVLTCEASGSVTASTMSGGLIGIVGAAGETDNIVGTIIDSKASGSVTGYAGIGGFAGLNFGTINDCYSGGNAVASSFESFAISGFVAANYNSISRCYSTGNVTGGNVFGPYLYTSGFVAVNGGEYDYVPDEGDTIVKYAQATINEAYSTGNVTSASGLNGGFAGVNNDGSIIRKSYSTGSVNGVDTVGGFSGENTGTIIDSYHSYGVTGNPSTAISAGFSAKNSGGLLRCFSAGSVEGASSTGGLIGENTGTFESCFYDENTYQSDTEKGTKETASNMKKQATFSGWDFNNTWLIDENSSRPYLSYQAYNWTGSSDASTWTDFGNWTVNLKKDYGYPYTGVQSVFFNSGSDSVVIPSGITVGRLHLGQGFSGTIALGGALTIDNAGEREGSLVIQGGTLNAASGSININGNFRKIGGTFTCGNSTVNFTDEAVSSSIEGSSSFYNFRCAAPGKTISFEAGSIQTMEGYFSVSGTSGTKVKLTSMLPGTQWSIDPRAARSVSIVDVADSRNIAEAAIRAVNSTNGGNNINWLFGTSGKTQTIIIY